MEYPKSLEALKESFQKLPSIGKKTAERLAIYVFSNMSETDVEVFSKSLIEVKSNIKRCKICGNLTDGNICDVCKDSNRDKTIIMIVENVKDLFVLENLNMFKGVYHVLGGAIDFSKGVGVDDLNIKSLIERVKNENIKEIILATNATLEGETTARYIKALLEDFDVHVTRIAHGLPVGGDLSYADETTVLKALENRRDYE